MPEPGGTVASPSNVPIPDPTALTTAQIFSEIAHLKELMETDIDRVESFEHARHVAEAKLIEVRFAERDLRFNLAAVDNEKAISKQEKATDEAIRLTTVRFDELRDRVSSIEATILGLAQNKAGSSNTLAQIVSFIFMIIAILGMTVTIIGTR